jgi:thiosulfate/3-mercaptopyruvate sulfurtransferase
MEGLSSVTTPSDPFTPLPPVVPASWAAQPLDNLVFADVRWYLDGRSGHDAYLAAHLPGAVWVDVDTVLSDPPSPAGGRHPLPSPPDFARRLGRLGIGDDDVVVAYDDAGGCFAARLVWLLRRTGQRAALIDGGLAAWPGPLASGEVARPPVSRRVNPWPADLLRTADQVQASASSPGTVLLDARARDRYTGATALPGESRAGHIPGARSAPWTGNLRADGRFLTPGELRVRFADYGAEDAEDVIIYCGSGVTACHDLLALERAGLPVASLFVGSWSAWSADQARPVTAGHRPTDWQPTKR